MSTPRHEIAVSTWSLQYLTLAKGMPLEELLPILASFSIDGIEINEDYSRLPQYGKPSARWELRRRIEDLGLRVVSTWFNTDLLGGMENAALATVLGEVEKCFEIARDLGTEVVTITPTDPSPDYSPERGTENFRTALLQLLPLAKSYGIAIGIETARSQGIVRVPQFVTQLVRSINASELTVVPDFEAWRLATPDLPLTHVGDTDAASAPASLALFEDALPNTRLVHAKLLRLDEHGEEPHFPIAELMSAVRGSNRSHVLNVEYEGWIPDIDPHLDCVRETARCVTLIKRYLNQS